MLKKSLLLLVFLILQLIGAEENNQAPKNTPPELNPANARVHQTLTPRSLLKTITLIC
ncbi:hypothetical protein ACMAV3_03650 [Helicobacter pylori]